MKLPPYIKLIAMSKEKIDEKLAPLRASKAKAQANLEMAKLDEQLAVLESEITETCTKQDIYFSTLIEKMYKFALLERKKTQYQKILSELFPE